MQKYYCLIKNLKRHRCDRVSHNLHSPQHSNTHCTLQIESITTHYWTLVVIQLQYYYCGKCYRASIPILTSPQVSPAINISERACPRQLVNICQQRRTRGKSFYFHSLLIKLTCLFRMMQKCNQMSFAGFLKQWSMD